MTLCDLCNYALETGPRQLIYLTGLAHACQDQGPKIQDRWHFVL